MNIVEISPHLFTFSSWINKPVKAYFTDRVYDFSCDYSEQLKELLTLGPTDKLFVFPKQTHGSNINFVSSKNAGELFECDGLLTKELGLAVGIRTADCVPVFVFSPGNNICGVIHAGWRSVCAGIIECLIGCLKEQTSDLRSLSVAVGPCIRECCFEVKDDTACFFEKSLIKKDGKVFVDLVADIKKRFIKAGVDLSQIDDAGICTACKSDTFFSYRRLKDSGRMVSLIFMPG